MCKSPMSIIEVRIRKGPVPLGYDYVHYNVQLRESLEHEAVVYWKRFSAAFQLITSQMALKYSAFLFWYWR
jgi:hypothetical protein